mmetsp:Transcript_14828/g.28550  ORF Transcript_14828/g.28550 Transcript_14828/m.28550 type:complete len:338 (+) Transcript_14828:3813-4826(+)
MAQQAMVDVPRHGCLVHCKRLHRQLHAVEGRRLPHKVHAKPHGAVSGHVLVRAQLQRHFLRVGCDLDHMPIALPRGREAQVELVSGHEAQLIVILGEEEPRDALLVQAHVPPHRDAILGLRLLGHLVVVRLQLNQRAKDVLMLVGVLISQSNGLRLVINAGLFKILPRCIRVCFPQLLHFVDLLGGDLAHTQLLLFGWHLDQPGQEAAVHNQRLPRGQVPVHVFQAVRREAGLSAQQHHDVLCARVDEPQQEHVAAPAVVALEQRLSHLAGLVQGNLLVLGAHQMAHHMAGGSLATRVTEPFLAPRCSAAHYAIRVVNPTMFARVLWQLQGRAVFVV